MICNIIIIDPYYIVIFYFYLLMIEIKIFLIQDNEKKFL